MNFHSVFIFYSQIFRAILTKSKQEETEENNENLTVCLRLSLFGKSWPSFEWTNHSFECSEFCKLADLFIQRTRFSNQGQCRVIQSGKTNHFELRFSFALTQLARLFLQKKTAKILPRKLVIFVHCFRTESEIFRVFSKKINIFFSIFFGVFFPFLL